MEILIVARRSIRGTSAVTLSVRHTTTRMSEDSSPAMKSRSRELRTPEGLLKFIFLLPCECDASSRSQRTWRPMRPTHAPQMTGDQLRAAANYQKKRIELDLVQKLPVLKDAKIQKFEMLQVRNSPEISRKCYCRSRALPSSPPPAPPAAWVALNLEPSRQPAKFVATTSVW